MSFILDYLSDMQKNQKNIVKMSARIHLHHTYLSRVLQTYSLALFFDKLVNKIVAKRDQMTLDVMYNIVQDV
jgi:hypothetical protein